MLLYFINTPIINALQALDKSKEAFIIMVIISIVRLTTLFITSLFKIGMYGLILGIILSLITSTFLHTKALKDALSIKSFS